MYTSKLTWLSTFHTASHRNPQRIILNKKKMNSRPPAFASYKNNPYLCGNDEEKTNFAFHKPSRHVALWQPLAPAKPKQKNV